MLSSTGWGVLAWGLVLGGVGWWLGYPEAAVVSAACLIAVVLALLWTVRSPSLEARRGVVPQRVARGDTATGMLTVVNREGRTRRGVRALDTCGGEEFELDLPSLPAGGTHEVCYSLPTRHRGRLEVGPLQLVRTDPLGLARRLRDCGGMATLLVRPRVCALPVLPSGRSHHVDGPSRDGADEGSLTFHALREYVIGDDLRRVHWRSTARTGKLMTRQMVDLSLPHTSILLDTRTGAYPVGPGDPAGGEAFETAVDVAASVAVAARRGNFPVRVLTAEGSFVDADGGSGAEVLLDRLALVRARAAGSIGGALDDLGRTPSGGALVVVTGLGDVSGFGRLSTVARRFDRCVVVRVGDGGNQGGGKRGDVPGDLPHLVVDNLEAFAVGWHREVAR